MTDSPSEFRPTDWSSWRAAVVATLLFVVKDGQVLLIRKKRGLGAGKINGPGGKVEPGETPLEGALRETEEELGIQPFGVREAGRLGFQFVDGMSLYVHVFHADGCAGEPQETAEAAPLWTPADSIPFEEMWA
ncbi:MAG: 8-oxo-dGTP diphosphatase, partial [Verrucomicrobiaceae bacterium]